MGGVRRWLIDNQGRTLSACGGVAFIAMVAELALAATRHFSLGTMLFFAGSLGAVCYLVARSIIVRTFSLGVIGVAFAAVSVVLAVLPVPLHEQLGGLAWLPVLVVFWELWRRPGVDDREATAPGAPQAPDASGAPAATEPAAPATGAGEAPARERLTVNDPGFEYLPPPRS